MDPNDACSLPIVKVHKTTEFDFIDDFFHIKCLYVSRVSSY